MSLVALQFDLLRRAAKLLEPADVEPYFRLRTLLRSTDAGSRDEFRRLYSRFYGLNAGGLTENFRKRYFELLFGLQLLPGAEPPYASLLNELWSFRRLKGDQVLAASFVSKLVATHDESRPLFDRHVGNFFGIGVPGAGSREFKILGFIANLERIRSQYLSWASLADFESLNGGLVDRIPALGQSHAVRIFDFLVWTAGRKRIDMPLKVKKLKRRGSLT